MFIRANATIRAAAHEIFNSWSSWDSEAGQDAQNEQDSDAYTMTMYVRLVEVLNKHFDPPRAKCGMKSHHIDCDCNGMGGDR